MSVYFIAQGTDGPIKIGYTDGLVSDRLSNLQVGSATQLVLLTVVPGSKEEEADLHKRFEDDHIRGEWFYRSEELVSYIESFAKPSFGLWFQSQQGRDDIVGSLSTEICAEGPMAADWADQGPRCDTIVDIRRIIPVSVYITSSPKAKSVVEGAWKEYKNIYL